MTTDDKQKILIVDDEALNINVLVDLLKGDYKTVVAKNGEQALKRVMSENPPDLVLLDIMMPDMDGYEVCQRIKAHEPATDIPIIFVTAMDEVDDEKKGLALGAVDYITKPLSPSLLKARIETHLKLKDNLNRQKQLNSELQTALNEIKTLKGLLPICANCKKIRSKDCDPKQRESWAPIETYISERSEADFTHSICPDCMTILYPGISYE